MFLCRAEVSHLAGLFCFYKSQLILNHESYESQLNVISLAFND